MPAFALLCLALALLLITAGLGARCCISATRNAPGGPSASGGRPGCRARASRRSSPISPRWLFGYALLTGQDGLATAAGLLAAVGAVVTVWCTGMIYASLKPIPQWHHPLVAPGYLLLAAYSGMALLAAVSAIGGVVPGPASFIVTLGLAGLVLKIAYWRMVDGGMGGSTAESATSLGFIGKVRPLDPPHTETNYLLREMGFRLARKHAAKLRNLTLLLGFGLPILLALLATQLGFGGLLLPLAALMALAGMLLERWLMFAEARHTVTLYYRG